MTLILVWLHNYVIQMTKAQYSSTCWKDGRIKYMTISLYIVAYVRRCYLHHDNVKSMIV